MADNTPSDEQLLYTTFQQLADVILPLKPELRERAHAMLGMFLGITTQDAGAAVDSALPPAVHPSPTPAKAASREPSSPKDFLSQRKPKTDVERVACIAYYLTHYRTTKHFKTIDIANLNTEAGQRKFANAATSVGNATRAGFVAAVSRGMKQLTAEGKRYVEALPDQTAAKAAFGKKKAKRQRRQRTTGKASAAA